MKKIIGPAGLMIHGIHKDDQKPLSQGSISCKNFEKIIIKLKKRILNADEWIYKTRKQILNSKDLCITLDDNLLIACKVGTIRLIKIQRPGKKVMNVKDVLNGWPVGIGEALNER